MVLGIRADFLGRCSEYGGLANKIQGHQLLVTPLEEDEIEEVIKKPAALVAMDVEPNLVAQMREDFLRNPGSLPLLLLQALTIPPASGICQTRRLNSRSLSPSRIAAIYSV